MYCTESWIYKKAQILKILCCCFAKFIKFLLTQPLWEFSQFLKGVWGCLLRWWNQLKWSLFFFTNICCSSWKKHPNISFAFKWTSVFHVYLCRGCLQSPSKWPFHARMQLKQCGLTDWISMPLQCVPAAFTPVLWAVCLWSGQRTLMPGVDRTDELVQKEKKKSQICNCNFMFSYTSPMITVSKPH